MATHVILALSKDQHHHFAPLYDVPGWEIVETAEWHPETVRQVSPDILLTPSCDWFESDACIKEARRLGIPSLYLMDGIIEWRHQWENPRFGAGGQIPYNQPVTTDKIACLGWQSARTLEAWGNAGKCEIVGAPRFDHFLTQSLTRRQADGRKRLLVMTANKPGFTQTQVDQVEQSLRDVQACLLNHPEWEPIWRVRRGLDEKLGLPDRFAHLKGQPLRRVLEEADAVLTTPSTVILESMLAHLPTVILDYTNSPGYVGAAWTITSREHIDPVLPDLADPPTPRLALQDEILHNCLECHTPALPRLQHLIEQMADIAREARAQGRQPQYPGRMVPVDFGGQALPSEHFDLELLYPDHPVFKNKEVRALQYELIFARQEAEKFKKELEVRRFGYWFGLLMQKALILLRK